MDHQIRTVQFANAAQIQDADGVLAALKSWHPSETEFVGLSEPAKSTLIAHTPYCGLINLFRASPLLCSTRKRSFATEEDEIAHHLLTLGNNERRQTGDSAFVECMEEFDENWAFFTEGCLENVLNWSNIAVAGGAVQACLTAVNEDIQVNADLLLDHYRKGVYKHSNIDIYIYGLDKLQAERKTREVVRNIFATIPILKVVNNSFTVTLFPTKPCRPIQIFQLPFHSPADILASFNIDSCTCLFNGTDVYLSPCGITAHMCQLNRLDLNNACPTYPIRLAKYALRGFEISAPTLDRSLVYDEEDSREDCLLGLLLEMEREIEKCPTVARQLKVVKQYAHHFATSNYLPYFE